MSYFTTSDNDGLSTKSSDIQNTAVVVIGRNEGARLVECLNSLVSKTSCLVYVDSGSTDSSCESAQSLGAEVVNLDISVPFTAARARNAGFRRALERNPAFESIMFVDGDCVIADGFLEAGNSKLETNPKLAVVVGRLREQYPDRSVYNRLCDAEWAKPVGPIRACGGNALIRAAAFQGVDGYREDLIAGEEPELCVRLANNGWTMECIDAEMGFHDAKLTKFSQWWKRSTRCGHAFAEGFSLHGNGPIRHNAKQLKSVVVWGLLVPCLSVISSSMALTSTGRLAFLFTAVALAWPAGWFLLAFRIFRFRRSMGDSIKHALLYSVFCVFGKIPNSLGALNFFWLRLIGKRRRIIEY